MAKKSEIVGRVEELKVLKDIFKSNKSEFLAIYGRRRVGKTFLIYNFFNEANCTFFYVSGIKNHTIDEQIEEFTKQLSRTFYNNVKLASYRKWLDVFEVLTQVINNFSKKKKIVLFFDEFPWMVTKKSKLLQALDYYWNRFWVHNPNVKLIICGSAASWITTNIINNKEGLYNRVTRIIELKPFDLAETKLFLEHSGIKLNNAHILNLYMIFGGIPYYLAMIEKGRTAEQCIDRLCFRANGSLFDEFNRIFASLFANNNAYYIKIIKILAKHRYGLAQAEILRKCKIPEGGRAVARLKELEQSGFITSFLPCNRTEKGIYYKIIDEFTLFYLNWVEPKKAIIKREEKLRNYWQNQAASPSWFNWAGYAFETICYKHVSIIRTVLGIDVSADSGTWRQISKNANQESGAQIDLLFDRKDNSITICEIKYSREPFIINKQYAANLVNKMKVYQKSTKTNKQIFLAMISVNGIKPTMYSEELISNVVTLDDLFS